MNSLTTADIVEEFHAEGTTTMYKDGVKCFKKWAEAGNHQGLIVNGEMVLPVSCDVLLEYMTHKSKVWGIYLVFKNIINFVL